MLTSKWGPAVDGKGNMKFGGQKRGAELIKDLASKKVRASFNNCEMTSDFSTADDVLKAMEQRLDWLRTRPACAGFIPFLQTYFLVTRRVIRADQQEHLFIDSDALRRLDIFFAQQYFDPLDAFLSTGAGPTPWNTYYQYCSGKNPRAFVATLLGINAHINGDLPVALAMTPYTNKPDFDQVDQLLSEVVSDLMRFLAQEGNDLQAKGAVFLPWLTQHEFNKIVLEWRHQAWNNAQHIRPEQLEVQRCKLNEQTERVAQQLIQIFDRPVRSVFHHAKWHRLNVRL